MKPQLYRKKRQVSISVMKQGKDCTQSIENVDDKDKGKNIRPGYKQVKKSVKGM
jgi:hypothetical protein